MMFQIATFTLLFDLKIGTKQRIVITTVAITKNQIAISTLLNIPSKSKFLQASAIPPNPIARYATATITSERGITQDKRPLGVSFVTSVLMSVIFFKF